MWAGYSSSSTAFTHPESWSFQPLAVSDTLDGASRSPWLLAWCRLSHVTDVSLQKRKVQPCPKMLTRYRKFLLPRKHKQPHFPSTDGSNPSPASLFTGVSLL